jgi:phospholipid/cholesterol/gamma-HCH transport system ATP-binding protein
MIEVKNLFVSFNEVPILKDINLQIPEGKITVIAGNSGSGKTVLIKTIEGLIQPQSGCVTIDGTDIFAISVKELNTIRKEMAMLFQNSALFDSYNIAQNVAFPLTEHTKLSLAEITEIVKEKLELVGLPEVMAKMPSELSGGMRKRAALARAIVFDPKYIFYDEPTSGLDPAIAKGIISLMIDLHKKYRNTAVIITHDLNCINNTADYVIVIESGTVKFSGDYDYFLKSEDPYCRQFIDY